MMLFKFVAQIRYTPVSGRLNPPIQLKIPLLAP
jgi:hypothetical protein